MKVESDVLSYGGLDARRRSPRRRAGAERKARAVLREESAVEGQCSLDFPLRDADRVRLFLVSCRDSLNVSLEAQKAFGALSLVSCHL